MAFRAEIAPAALRDLHEAALYIALQSGEARAARWREEALELMLSLAEMPQSYVRAPEASSLRVDLRQVLHHSHRIIFHIDSESEVVSVLRVYHSRRRPLRVRDL